MAKRKAHAAWQGKLKDGNGNIELGNGALQGQYNFQSRFESGQGTNPEELIGGAHAACFSMALAHGLEEAGFDPQKIKTDAEVSIEQVEQGFKITTISLETRGTVPEIDEKVFLEHAEKAKRTCPVSQALAGAEIRLKAHLQSS
jgi:lipoyl-dependent peroxiredoxin